MGFFRRIGRAFRRVGRGVGRVFRRVGGFVKDGLSLVKKPLSKIIKPFKGVIGKVLKALPFGKAIKGLLSKFMGGPLAFLAGPLLGPFGAILTAASGVGQLAGVAQQASRTPAFANPQGRLNVLNMIAQRHGQLIRRR